MNRIKITLTNSSQTNFVPLAALGYALQRAGFLKSLQQFEMPIKTLTHTPGDKLIEALVLILTGARSTAQIDLVLRPNRPLAQAWGQAQFAQQATVADTLDAFEATSITALRQLFETLLRQHSRTLQHDFRKGMLWLDGDLTGLPASRGAEGSVPGYFPGEKNASVANWPGSRWHRIMRRWGRYCIPVPSRVSAVYVRSWNSRSTSCSSKRIKSRTSRGGWMRASAVIRR